MDNIFMRPIYTLFLTKFLFNKVHLYMFAKIMVYSKVSLG